MITLYSSFTQNPVARSSLSKLTLNVIMDHRVGWVFLPIALGIQLWAGTLFS